MVGNGRLPPLILRTEKSPDMNSVLIGEDGKDDQRLGCLVILFIYGWFPKCLFPNWCTHRNSMWARF